MRNKNPHKLRWIKRFFDYADAGLLIFISFLFIYFGLFCSNLRANNDNENNESNNIVKAICFEGTGEGSFFTGKGYTNRTISFVAYTDGKAWKIRVTGADSHFNFYESGSLGGTNPVYTIAENSALYLVKLASTNDKAVLNLQGLTWVERIPVPIIMDSCPYMAIIWYALCSSDYLNSVSDYKWLIPPYGVNNVSHYALLGLTNVSSSIIRSQLAPGLPELMMFIHNGWLWKDTGEIQYPDEFGRGFTNALFLAKRFLSIGDYHYPQEFAFLVQEPINDPAERAGKLKLNPSREMHFFTTNAYVIKMLSSEFIPKIRGRSVCVDLRFITREQPMMYLSYKTDRWLSETEVKELREYKNAVRRMEMCKKLIPSNIQKFGLFPKKPAVSPSRRLLSMCIIITVFLTPMLVFLLRKLLLKNKQKTITR